MPKVTAVIVTRGDIDLGPCLSRIKADEIIIRRGHNGVLERWQAADGATHDIVYTQDDDAIVDYEAVVAAYEPGVMTCNMPLDRRPAYHDDIALVGWGCVFHRRMVEPALLQYRNKFPADALFYREADRVVTGLSQLKLIDVPFEHLPVAFEKYRMGAQDDHWNYLRQIRERIYIVREAARRASILK